jgi:2-phosphoglycerate kinase
VRQAGCSGRTAKDIAAEVKRRRTKESRQNELLRMTLSLSEEEHADVAEKYDLKGAISGWAGTDSF